MSIRLCKKTYLDFIEFLNKNHPTEEDVSVTFFHGYDSVAVGEESCFACFLADPDGAVIMVAGLMPEGLPRDVDEDRFVCESIAHEYGHFIQFVSGQLGEEETEQTEEWATEFAKSACDAFFDDK